MNKKHIIVQSKTVEDSRVDLTLNSDEDKSLLEMQNFLHDTLSLENQKRFSILMEIYKLKVYVAERELVLANLESFNWLAKSIESKKKFQKRLETIHGRASNALKRATDLLIEFSSTIRKQKDELKMANKEIIYQEKMDTLLEENNVLIKEMTNFIQKKQFNSPLFSEAVTEFLKEKHNKKQSAINGYKLTFNLFLDVLGDKKIDEYTKKDVLAFKNTLAKLPSNNGKNIYKKETFQEAIQRAKNSGLKLISDKTVKNHFSRLSSLFEFHILQQGVENNIFLGRWGLKTRPKTRRITWSESNLKKLTEKPWKSKIISPKTAKMIVMIASYTGMRLEEICRLRQKDIQKIDDILCIKVQDHPALKNESRAEWSAKTEAGNRIIPICRKLQACGFPSILQHENADENSYLFPETEFTGIDNKRSTRFQRVFSKHKQSLSIGPETVFHSFRHTVSTQLRNRPDGERGIRESWIDAFLGHESEGRSVGSRSYFNEVDIKNLLLLRRPFPILIFGIFQRYFLKTMNRLYYIIYCIFM